MVIRPGPVSLPEATALTELARVRTSREPDRALLHANELDIQLAARGWTLPVTYGANGISSTGLPHPRTSDLSPDLVLATLARAEADASKEGYGATLAFAFRSAQGPEIRALNLLYANCATASESLWLKFFNKYLAYFGKSEEHDSNGAPYLIGLSRGVGDRFSRLRGAHAYAGVNSGPLISVLMPVRNAAATLKAAAESILNQTWRRLELILIDDCSNDPSMEVAEKLAAHDARVRLVQLNTPGGPYIAKNVGLQSATGDFITVHDADDWAFPTRLADQIRPILDDRSATLKVTMGKSLRMTASGLFTRFQPVGWVTSDGAMRWCFPSPLFERRFFLEKLGAWDSVRVGADTEIVQRVRRFAAQTIRVLDIPVMLQLDSEGSLTRHPDTYNDDRGEAPAREHYRQQWQRWHATHAEMPRFTFPLVQRPFDVMPALQGHALDVADLVRVTRGNR